MRSRSFSRRRAKASPVYASDGSISLNILNRFEHFIANGVQRRLLVPGRQTPAPAPGQSFTLTMKAEDGSLLEVFRGRSVPFCYLHPTYNAILPIGPTFRLTFPSEENAGHGRLELGCHEWNGQIEADLTIECESALNPFAVSCGWKNWAQLQQFYARNAYSPAMWGTLICWEKIEIIPRN